MSDAELLLLVESRKKSGVIAALLNLCLPGVGYMYCGRWILGIFVFVVFVPLILIGWLAGWLLGVVSGWGLFELVMLVDGFLCAERHNKKMIAELRESRAAAQNPGFADGARAARPVGAVVTRGFADA